VGDGLLYIQQVYIKRSAQEGAYPVLQYVIASFGGNVGYGATLDEALRVALGLKKADSTGAPEGGAADKNQHCDGAHKTNQVNQGNKGNKQGGQQTTGNATAYQLIDQAADEHQAAQDALQDGNLSAYQKHVNKMGDLLQRAKKILGEGSGGEGGGSGEGG